MILYSEEHPYVLRPHYLQLGWVIVNNNTRKRILHTSDKEVAKSAYDWLAKEFKSPTHDKDGTPNIVFELEVPQKFTPKLFVIELKDYNQYILIDSEENFKDSLFNLIKENYESRYSPFQKWEIPERLHTCMLSEKQIKKLPTDELRERVCKDIEKSKFELEAYERHNSLVDKVQDLVVNEKKDEVFKVFLDLGSMWWIRYEITDFYDK